jgi:hypothetical protein
MREPLFKKPVPALYATNFYMADGRASPFVRGSWPYVHATNSTATVQLWDMACKKVSELSCGPYDLRGLMLLNKK